MGIFKKFMDYMSLGDDYEDDDFYDEFDDEDEYEEKKPSKNKVSLMKKQETSVEDELDSLEHSPKRSSHSASRFSSASSQLSKITPIRHHESTKDMKVCVIKPTAVEDGREICETLIANKTIIINLEGLDIEIAQRIIDFTSGAAFAVEGNLQKISNYILLITPANIEISGDLEGLLSSTFDMSTMYRR